MYQGPFHLRPLFYGLVAPESIKKYNTYHMSQPKENFNDMLFWPKAEIDRQEAFWP